MKPQVARERLIVALDLPTAPAAISLAERLRGHVGMFKVGLELFSAEGPAVVRRLVSRGEKVFLDLKLHDIPNTVRGGARQAAQMGASLLTVHASGGTKMMQAALAGATEGSEGREVPLVLGVTILTSLGAGDLAEVGVNGPPESAVVRLAALAQRAGLGGVVASPREAAAIRGACGPGLVIVTPGIRPAEAQAQDQSRIATPAAAVRAGADYLVVGRPITEAADPAAAADLLLSELESAHTASG